MKDLSAVVDKLVDDARSLLAELSLPSLSLQSYVYKTSMSHASEDVFDSLIGVQKDVTYLTRDASGEQEVIQLREISKKVQSFCREYFTLPLVPSSDKELEIWQKQILNLNDNTSIARIFDLKKPYLLEIYVCYADLISPDVVKINRYMNSLQSYEGISYDNISITCSMDLLTKLKAMKKSFGAV